MSWYFILNFTLSLVCFFHTIIILINYLHPENPSVKKYEKNLMDIDFPVIFKLCFQKQNEDEMLQALGYRYMRDFYRGKSMYNGSLIGWSGHTEDGKTLGTVDGRVEETKKGYVYVY